MGAWAHILKAGLRRTRPYQLAAKLRGKLRARRMIRDFYARTEIPATGSPGLLAVIVPIYDAPPAQLWALWQSFHATPCPGARLILVDDASPSPKTQAWLTNLPPHPAVTVIRRAENGGISAALNSGLDATAQARWVTFLDHDDLIAPHGLNAIAQALDHSDPELAFLYTDEVLVDRRGGIIGWFFKPAFDPVLLSGVNYINHFSVYRRDRLMQVGPFQSAFDGSQDYELLLRYLKGVPDRAIRHLPYPAYCWRRGAQTYSRRHLDRTLTHARAALKTHISAPGFDTQVTAAGSTELHRVIFTPQTDTPKTDRPRAGAPGAEHWPEHWPEQQPKHWPSVGVVIPNRDAPQLLARLLADLFERTDYPNMQVAVVDDSSQNPETLRLYAAYQARHPNFQVIAKTGPFNFSRSVNLGMAALATDHFLLANNDIEIRDPGWLREMVSCLAYDRVGIVGAKLLTSDGRLQHAGVIVGQGGLAGHWYEGYPATEPGPMGRLWVRNSMTCVTGALMLITRDCLDAVGPWDTADFAVSFNDVDFCLRAHAQGFRTVWTPFACVTHLGSATRATSHDPSREHREEQALRARHHTQSWLDPASSPFVARGSSTAALAMPSDLPKPRRWFA